MEEPNYGNTFSPMRRINNVSTNQYSSKWEKIRMENQPAAGDEPALDSPQNDTPIKESGKRGARSPLDCQVRKKRVPDAPRRLGSITANKPFELICTTRVDLESESELMPTQ